MEAREVPEITIEAVQLGEATAAGSPGSWGWVVFGVDELLAAGSGCRTRGIAQYLGERWAREEGLLGFPPQQPAAVGSWAVTRVPEPRSPGSVGEDYTVESQGRVITVRTTYLGEVDDVAGGHADWAWEVYLDGQLVNTGDGVQVHGVAVYIGRRWCREKGYLPHPPEHSYFCR